MRVILFFAAMTLYMTTAMGQVAKTTAANPDPDKKLMKVEASCGECNFGMDGHDCDLAVMIDGKPYFVDGVGISEFGHPHGKDGFCLAVRHAEVQGDVVDGRFKASYFKLLPKEEPKGKDGKSKKGKK